MEIFPQQRSAQVLEHMTHPSCGSWWKRAVTSANNSNFTHNIAAVTTLLITNPLMAEVVEVQKPFYRAIKNEMNVSTHCFKPLETSQQY